MAIGNYYDADPDGMTTPPSTPVARTFTGAGWARNRP
jgi:hypothetical protein